jgi:hypothetical protein
MPESRLPSLRKLQSVASVALQKLAISKKRHPKDTQVQAWVGKVQKILERYRKTTKPSAAQVRSSGRAMRQLVAEIARLAKNKSRQKRAAASEGALAIFDPDCLKAAVDRCTACEAEMEASLTGIPEIDETIELIGDLICGAIFMADLVDCMNGAA